jgi:hypothetical protein
VKRNESEEDPASSQRTRSGGEAGRGDFATPPNPPPASTHSTPGRAFRPDFPVNQGSPSPQQQRLAQTPTTRNLPHSVPSSARRPETTSLSTQRMTPLAGEAIPVAPAVQVAWDRGDDARRASSTLASAVGGVFNLPSSSTTARPGPSSLSMRTSTATSRSARRARPYVHPAFINASDPSPPLPAISAVGPATEGHDSGESQNTNSTSSSGTAGANQAHAAEPMERVAGPSTPNRAAISRPGHGMPRLPGAQPLGALDPLRFTGAIRRRRGGANPETPRTPDSSARQAAPETPMASPTRYGTEISPSSRHRY